LAERLKRLARRLRNLLAWFDGRVKRTEARSAQVLVFLF
jgi:hypothetical protein